MVAVSSYLEPPPVPPPEKPPPPPIDAGGVGSFDDLHQLDICGNGKLNVTIGSALDLFGGTMEYKKVIDYIEKARNGYE